MTLTKDQLVTKIIRNNPFGAINIHCKLNDRQRYLDWTKVLCLNTTDYYTFPVNHLWWMSFSLVRFEGSIETGKTVRIINWWQRTTLICNRAKDEGQCGYRTTSAFRYFFVPTAMCQLWGNKSRTPAVFQWKILDCILDFCPWNYYVFFFVCITIRFLRVIQRIKQHVFTHSYSSSLHGTSY